MSKNSKTNIFLFLYLFLLISCSTNSSETIRDVFEEVIVKDDLETIIKDSKHENVIDTPYYDIVLYEDKKKGKFTTKAIVDYFFLKKVKIKIQRKYRYNSYYKKWERYTNEYKFFN